jgi:tRNA 2-thiouridine synthesizing protein A
VTAPDGTPYPDGTPSEVPAAVLDCRGQHCPLPVITLAKRLPTVNVGEVLRLIADDPATARDVPAWCRMRGQEYLGELHLDGVPAFDVRRLS